MRVTGRVLVVRRHSIRLQVGEKRPWLPKGALTLQKGEYAVGATIEVSLSKKLAEYKGLA
ncbi:MAG: hypothetical protein C4567_01580 [Deltaproteobacteria bacterium]|nr:MAG: hypothetical protein C4567_01580 [Deltaproteobacteria bacterium]